MGDLQVLISEQQSQMPVVQVPEETCWDVTIVVVCECTAMTVRKKWWRGRVVRERERRERKESE